MRRPTVIAVEIPIRQERIVRTILRALEELTHHHDGVTLRLAVRRDATTPFNPWHAIQELGLAHKVVYLPFFDNTDLPDVIGDARIWLETSAALNANLYLAMQRGVTVAGPSALPVPADCFWSVGDFDQAGELAKRLAALLASEERMDGLKARAKQHVTDRLPFSCEPVPYVSPHQERLVHGWYTNQHFVLVVTSGTTDETKRWLERLRHLGYRIICIHYALPEQGGQLVSEHVDHFFSVPATSALVGINHAPYDLHVDDWCGGELTLKVQEICNSYSVGICFVQGAHLSRVLDRIPERIRRVLAIDGEASLNQDGERTASARADVVIAREDDERSLQQALAPSFTIPESAQRHFLGYHDVTMQYLHRFVRNFDGQVMLEVGPDDHLAVARSVLANGAAQVIGVQTTERTYDELPDRLQFTMVSPTRWVGIEDDSIDVVYGVGVLEHITHFDAVVGEIARVLKPGGRVFLQGCPMWTSSHGHHVVVFDAVAGDLKYDFMRPGRNPLESWQHLALTPDQIRNELLGKQVPESDAGEILGMVFGDGIGSNKKVPGDIIAAFRNRLETDAVRYLDAGERTTHYRAAEQRYPEKELLTDALLIYARKPLPASAPSRAARPLVTIIVPLALLGPTMREALESIATQTYTDLQVVLVTDGLAGLKVAEEYAGVDSRFRLLSPSSTQDRDGGDHVLLYDGNTALDCRAVETLVLSRCLLDSSITPPGLSDFGPAPLATTAVKELR